MKHVDDAPFYIVVAAVLANILIGIRTQAGFTALMLRSIVVTVVAAVFGYLLTATLKKAVEASRENNEKRRNNNDTGQSDSSETSNGNTIDIAVPPIDDSELSSIGLGREDDGEFTEINPAFMKYGVHKERIE